MIPDIIYISIYPYLECMEIAVDSLIKAGFTQEEIDSVEEGEILQNVPLSAMGCPKRAILGKDLAGKACAYLYPTGYKIPAMFFEVIDE